jgi:hypothetical protein
MAIFGLKAEFWYRQEAHNPKPAFRRMKARAAFEELTGGITDKCIEAFGNKNNA